MTGWVLRDGDWVEADSMSYDEVVYPKPKQGKTKASHAAYQRWYRAERIRVNGRFTGGALTLRSTVRTLTDRDYR
jgi:hypothetical protein